MLLADFKHFMTYAVIAYLFTF